MDLTPRSKVKAMLDALDSDDSDKENRSQQPSNPLSPSTKRTTIPSNKPASPSPDRRDLDSSGDEEEPAHPQPRQGTLAARMLEEAPASESRNESGSDANAYERVRLRLLEENGNSGDPPPVEHTTPENSRVEGKEALINGETSPPLFQEANQGIEPEETSGSPYATAEESREDRSSSPGLFVSPRKANSVEMTSAERDEAASESEPPEQSQMNDKLKALLKRRREERLSKQVEGHVEEDEEDDELQTTQAPRPAKKRKNLVRVESEDDEDKDVGKKFTQEAKPTRKASKKALEEMNRETQRMSRNMQLTHDAKTKVKFSTADFLAKMNFRQPQTTTEDPPVRSTGGQRETLADGAVSSSTPGTPGDVRDVETPPSSPPSVGKQPLPKAIAVLFTNEAVADETQTQLLCAAIDVKDDNDDLPDLNTVLSQIQEHKDTPPSPPREVNTLENANPHLQKRVTVRQYAKSAKGRVTEEDSDDDLEIVAEKPATSKRKKPSRLPVFDNIPESKKKEPHSLHTLRALAQLHDGDKARGKKERTTDATTSRNLILRRAKEQAKQAQEEKLQKLRERGVIVQTAEEKEKEQMQLENMLEKARQEAEEIAKREKEAAKREGKDINDESGLPDSEDEDEDYQASDEEEENEMSGSEDEEAIANEDSEAENEGEDEGPPQEEVGSNLFDAEAAEDDEEEEEDISDDHEDMADSEVEVSAAFPKIVPRKSARKVILSDDEEEDEALPAPKTPAAVSKAASTPRSAAADAFGFQRNNLGAIGLSQVFAGTMAESQEEDDTSAPGGARHDSLDFLRAFSTPNAQVDAVEASIESPAFLVGDSQQQARSTFLAASNEHVFLDSPTKQPFDATQASQAPEPTQDIGFQIVDSQLDDGANVHSTIDTVPLQNSGQGELLSPRRKLGRLQRGGGNAKTFEDIEDVGFDEVAEAEDELDEAHDAFRIMKSAAKKPKQAENAFDKKKSDAKGMVEEQAEESEDEYAGLGGASDDESGGEFDEETKKIIDDEDKAVTDERDIAAYYAERDRNDDEKNVEKLYKDIINGGLRRKRGAEHDLWDSDDEDEAAARRRAAKQRELAKMRKALLADEKLGKIAENPKQQAFLKAIEDRDDHEDTSFLDVAVEQVTQVTDSQSTEVDSGRQVLSTVSVNAVKRTYSEYSQDGHASKTENRPPSNPRRTNKFTKPTSITEIRNTLSEIIGEPESVLESQLVESPLVQSDRDSDQGSDADENESAARSRPASPIKPPRRSATDPARAAVIDRMALKRAATTFRNNSMSSDRLAFHASSKGTLSGFKVPSLLRRATTNSNASTTSESQGSSTSGSIAGSGAKELVKMGGTKKSSVNYYVREQEKKRKLEEVEKERTEGRAKLGKMRRKVGGLGELVGGSFG